VFSFDVKKKKILHEKAMKYLRSKPHARAHYFMRRRLAG